MRYNLSEINSIIRDRRTIYPEQYSDRKVHQEQIELLLNNAIWAPTHGNTQPWRFIVFQEDAKTELAEALGNAYISETPKEMQTDAKLGKMMTRPKLAPVVIAIVLHREKNSKISFNDEFAAVSCAVQNMHLTCTAAGLGGFWSTPGILESSSFRKFLQLEEEDMCIGLFYVGYPSIEWPKGQRKPIEYITTWRK